MAQVLGWHRGDPCQSMLSRWMSMFWIVELSQKKMTINHLMDGKQHLPAGTNDARSTMMIVQRTTLLQSIVRCGVVIMGGKNNQGEVGDNEVMTWKIWSEICGDIAL